MSVYPNLSFCHGNNIYQDFNKNSYNEPTQELLDNAEAYAKKIIGQPSLSPRAPRAQSGMDLRAIVSSILDILHVLSMQNRPTNHTKVYIGSNNGNKTTVYNHPSSENPSPEDVRNKKAKQERSDRLIAGIAAVLIGGISIYFLAKFNQEIRDSHEAASAILSKRDFFTDVQDRNIADIHWVGAMHVRMLEREEEDAKYSCLKAICGIATAAMMGTGAIFGSMLAIQVSGMCALILSGKVLYDCLRTSKNSRENRKDALALLSLIEKLKNAVIFPPATFPPVIQPPTAQEQWFKLGMNEENWKNAALPPSYEEAINPAPSAPDLFPQPSAPDFPPPSYTPSPIAAPTKSIEDY